MTLELRIQPIILHLCVIKQVAGKIIVGDHLVPPLGLAQIIHLMRITTAKKGLYNVSVALGGDFNEFILYSWDKVNQYSVSLEQFLNNDSQEHTSNYTSKKAK